MAFLNLVASITRKSLIVSKTLAEPTQLARFAHADTYQGVIAVVEETSDPTTPTSDVAIDGATVVDLTDGAGLVYAAGSNIAIGNVNEVSFDMLVDSLDLIAALVAATTDTANPKDYVEAFLECRITKDAQDYLLLREPTLIFTTATAP